MITPSAMPVSLPARQVAPLGNLELVCGIVVATALAGETFTLLQLAGAAFVLVGVWVGSSSFTLARSMFQGRLQPVPAAS